jgi:Pro-kumamolisin, activation domain/Bacterial Ig-like domain (group 3)/Subtilase family
MSIAPANEGGARLKMTSVRRRWHFAALFLASALLWPSTAAAQAPNPARPLVTQAVDEAKTITLRGTVHPLAQARFDQGAVADSFAAKRMLLTLNRPPERSAALRQFLNDVHTQGSTAYHQWLTPAQFGELFGPSDSDIQAATTWLASHGFQVARVTKGKNLIEFSGTAANVRAAFHTEIHRYVVNNETHYANASDLAIPEALAPLIRGVSPINNFRSKPAAHVLGTALYSHPPGKAAPSFTLNGDSFFAIAPEDFATQYDLGPLYTASVNGAGQTIGIIGESNIDIALVNAYRQIFALSNNPPQVVIDGNDPGIDPLPNSDIEAYLDVELSGAVAPAATVNLYISDGSDIQDPAYLSAVRAVEDNQASVLSVSLSNCEADLGAEGNFIWNAAWEQAAAQGQTVLVATGDSGSAGCDSFGGDQPATQGLAVNGLASTPWNVAVGGTDFSYSNYAAGLSAATPFWNLTNDAANGSLIASLPEQPWDAAFGFNIIPEPGLLLAGGGGASSCGAWVGFTSCSGYPKPIWQMGAGVPADGVRDLPDVSLFASSGSNLSAYVVCAEEGECTGAQFQILGVGGTSTSTPAMAGIMALVDQKFGRQGQADFTLYALAHQQPSVFHDVTTGTINVPCQQGTPDCSLDIDGDGFYSLQEYPATPGYDLASGLGSVDANALVSNWNKVSFLSTTTTLSLSQSSFPHGTQVTFTANVASPSQGTPTGNVGILTSSGLPLQMNDSIPVVNGVASEQVGFFPGGTYQISAQYDGDSIFGPSTSAPQTVTVTPESSSIYFVGESPQGNFINTGAQSGYGGRWILTAEPYGTNGIGLFGLATGDVTFTDTNGTTTTSQQVPIDSMGVAGYSPAVIPFGTNSFTLKYSGDGSYLPSTAGPFVVTITPGSPLILFATEQTSVPVGGNLVVSVALGPDFGAPPTGNVVFTLGAATITAPLTPGLFDGFPAAVGTATLTNLTTPGNFSLKASYAGDSNWAATNATYSSLISVVPASPAASLTTLSISPGSITRTQSTTFVATVTSASGNPPAPTGTVVFFVNGLGLPGTLSPTGPATSTASPSGAVPAQVLSSGANQVIASYSGDASYNASASVPGTVNVNLGTFSLSLSDARISIPSGQSASVPIVLNGIGGFSGAVPLACAPSNSAISCSENPSTPMVSGVTASSLTINAWSLHEIAGTSPAPLDRAGRTTPAVALALGFSLFFVAYRRPRRIPAARWVCGVSVFILLLVVAGCGGGSGGPPPPPPPTKVSAPAGAYNVVVSATFGGTTHNVTLVVEVQ